MDPTAEALIDRLVGAWADVAREAIHQRGVFHAALSGGSTPKPFYEKLGTDLRCSDHWLHTHIWVVDERRVSQDDQRSNFRMIRHALIDPAHVAGERVHPVPVSDDDPAAAYEAQLRRVFQARRGVPRLDFVLLGVGDDAHTASLFPGSPAQSAKGWVANNEGPSVTPPPRVTMTYRLLNGAREIGVLVTGSGKAGVLRRVAQQLREHGPDPVALPITGVQPTAGRLTWYLDAAAASGLSPKTSS